MATSFEEIYCLNSVIKFDKRLNNKPKYALYDLYWKYLQYAISMFYYDCKKDLYDLNPFSLTEYEFVGDGENNIFNLNPAPLTSSFDIYVQLDCSEEKRQIVDYEWDEKSNTITFKSYTPAINESIFIYSYNIGSFTADLDYNEKTILAKAMNIPYYEEQVANSKTLVFSTYGGSVKMHSQAEHLKTTIEAFEKCKREVEGDINAYSYRVAPLGLKGLGARTVCLNPLRYKKT